MNNRQIRRLGILFAFFALGGCAISPDQPASEANAPLTTGTAQVASPADAASGPFDATLASLAQEHDGKSLAAAQSAGDDTTPTAVFRQTGRASWYGRLFHGRRTANGERFDMNALTAAHRTLPLGSYVRVTDERTARSVVVRINDRGPYVRGRVIDLSLAAARVLHLAGRGTANVKIEALNPAEGRQAISEMVASNEAAPERTR